MQGLIYLIVGLLASLSRTGLLQAGEVFDDIIAKNLSLDSETAPVFSYQIDNPQIKSYETSMLALDDLRLGDGENTMPCLVPCRPLCRPSAKTIRLK
ncbi:MAG: hypothetical protein GY935_26160 [Gammaproteobacteria bacterium]|nr:hypothetical protein [Gammaproteobacteria bacterium]